MPLDKLIDLMQSLAKTAWLVQDFTSWCQNKHATDDAAISGTHRHTNTLQNTQPQTHRQPNKTTHNKAIKHVNSCTGVSLAWNGTAKHEGACTFNYIRLCYVH